MASEEAELADLIRRAKGLLNLPVKPPGKKKAEIEAIVNSDPPTPENLPHVLKRTKRIVKRYEDEAIKGKWDKK